jgi:hypothetical protein
VTLTLAIAGALGAALPADTTMARGTVGAAKARAAKKARKKVKSLLHKAGIAKLPSVTSALAGRSGSGQLATAVVGTPPALIEIPGQPIKDLFWQPGVIDAIAASSASQDQCSEFYAGGIDGVSGGLGACHMAESVGYSFSDILQGDSSLCYMKRVPTPANVAAGGVTVVSGSLPGNDITRVFSVPRGAHSRVVTVAINRDPGGGGSQVVFLRVYGEAANHAAGNFYHVDLWFCKNGPSAPPRGYDRITIDTAGHFVDVSSESESGDGNGGAHVSTVEGYLTFTDGNVAYDTSRPRRARVESEWGDQGFKSAIEIRTDDTMTVKSYDAGQYGARKAYAVSSFAGTGPDSLRFLAGAFRERQAQDGVTFSNSQTGATEYRSSFYAAAPGSELVTQLDDVDLDSDEFFANPPAPEVDVSGFACDTTPDVELTLDFTNPTVASATAECEDRRFDGMHFCHEDPDVQDAEQNYGPACWPGPH